LKPDGIEIELSSASATDGTPSRAAVATTMRTILRNAVLL
jgi:hypothetical protein